MKLLDHIDMSKIYGERGISFVNTVKQLQNHKSARRCPQVRKSKQSRNATNGISGKWCSILDSLILSTDLPTMSKNSWRKTFTITNYLFCSEHLTFKSVSRTARQIKLKFTVVINMESDRSIKCIIYRLLDKDVTPNVIIPWRLPRPPMKW